MIETDPEFLALMAACRDRPADDAPRLILSDWLEEHDEEPWAELIRVECRMGQTPVRLRGRLHKRAEQIRSALKQSWFDGLPDDVRPRFDRGLPELSPTWDQLHRVELQAWFDTPTSARLCKTAVAFGIGTRPVLPRGHLNLPAKFRPSLALALYIHDTPSKVSCVSPMNASTSDPVSMPFRTWLTGLCRSEFMTADLPFVRRLSVSGWEPIADWDQFFGAADLRQLDRLTITGQAASQVLTVLMNRRLDTVTRLSVCVGRERSCARELAAVAVAGVFPNLEELETNDCRAGQRYASFMRTSWGRTLSAVSTVSVGMTPDDLRALADAGVLKRMAKARQIKRGNMALDLRYNVLGSAGATFLASWPALADYQSLVLRGNNLADAGTVALAQSIHVRQLSWLDLSSNQVGDFGALALAESPHLSCLRDLNLADNQISPTAQSELRNRFGKNVRLI